MDGLISFFLNIDTFCIFTQLKKDYLENTHTHMRSHAYTQEEKVIECNRLLIKLDECNQFVIDSF